MNRAGATLVLRLFGIVNLAMGPPVAVLVLRDAIGAELGAPRVAFTALYAVYFLGAGAAGVFGRPLLQRLGLLRSLAIAALALCLGAILCAVSQSYWQFAASFAVFFALIGAAPFLSSLTGFVVLSLRERPAFSLAVASVGQLTAFWFWQGVFTGLKVVGWREAFLVLAVLGGLGVLSLAAPGFGEPNLAPRTADRRSVATDSSRGRFRAVCLVFFCVTLAGTLAVTRLPDFAGAALPTGISAFAIFSVAAFVGRLGAAAGYDAEVKGLIGAALIAHAAGLWLLLSNDAILAVLGLAIWSLAYGGVSPMLLVHTFAVHAGARANAGDIVLASACAGIAGGALIAPLLAPPEQKLIAACFAGIGLMIWVVERSRR